MVLCVVRAGDRIELTVSDNGVGMKAKDAVKIPENRGSDYVAIFVRQLGGAIVASEAVGEGTTIRVSIPLLLVPAGDPTLRAA